MIEPSCSTFYDWAGMVALLAFAFSRPSLGDVSNVAVDDVGQCPYLRAPESNWLD